MAKGERKERRMQVLNREVRDDLPLTEAEWAAWRGLPPAHSSSSSGEKRRKRKKKRKRKLPKTSSSRHGQRHPLRGAEAVPCGPDVFDDVSLWIGALLKNGSHLFSVCIA